MPVNPFASGSGLEPTYDTPVLLRPDEQQGCIGRGSATNAMRDAATVHLVTIFFHILFKALALVLYILSGMLLNGSYVLTFVFVTILSAVDFWTVKNVSGRLLVGLRWWNHIDADGTSRWRFESYEDSRSIHATDSSAFWITLFAAPVIWAVLAIGTLLSLHFMWLILILVAFTCNAINVVGYVKCKKDARKKLSALGGTMLHRGIEMWSSRTSTFRNASGL